MVTGSASARVSGAMRVQDLAEYSTVVYIQVELTSETT